MEECPECKSTHLIVDSRKGEVSCAKCGLVFEENMIDRGPEWRAFDHEQQNRRARTGAPLCFAISDRGLSTDIGWKNKDSKGHNIPERNIAQINRIRRWHRRLRISSAGERNLAFALGEVDRLSSRLRIPRDVREDASKIYRDAARNKLIRGRSIESMVAASVYAACRRFKIPRTLDEMAEASKVSKKQLGKNYRFLSRKLNLNIKPTSPIDYIPRFASQLQLSGKVQSKAIQILKESINAGLTNGKGPSGLAATALYIASILLNERKTQRDVAEIAGVTEVTIRNRCREFSELDIGVTL